MRTGKEKNIASQEKTKTLQKQRGREGTKTRQKENASYMRKTRKGVKHQDETKTLDTT
jgi:hypothetical protein